MNIHQIIRLTKSALVGFFGLYVLVVAFGNVTDYNSNFMFVQHVLSMDTTFDGNKLMYRAITSPTIHHVGYILIIITEWFIALACIIGSIQMVRNLKASSEIFQSAKKWGIIGLLCGVALWFFGFQVVGGEWFAMWQSEVWNGLTSAFRITTYITGVLIILMMKEEA